MYIQKLKTANPKILPYLNRITNEAKLRTSSTNSTHPWWLLFTRPFTIFNSNSHCSLNSM